MPVSSVQKKLSTPQIETSVKLGLFLPNRIASIAVGYAVNLLYDLQYSYLHRTNRYKYVQFWFIMFFVITYSLITITIVIFRRYRNNASTFCKTKFLFTTIRIVALHLYLFYIIGITQKII